MTTFNFPHSNQETDLQELESQEASEVEGIIRAMLTDEEELQGSLDVVLTNLKSAQVLLNRASEQHSESAMLSLGQGLGRELGSLTEAPEESLGRFIEITSRNAGLAAAAIDELNDYQGLPGKLWDSIKGREFAAQTSNLTVGMSEDADGKSPGSISEVIAGHVDQVKALAGNVNKWTEYVGIQAGRSEAAVEWLSAELSKLDQEEQSEDKPEE